MPDPLDSGGHDFETRDFWYFDGSGGCNLCQDKTGGYHGEPVRPHDHCKCPITDHEVKCEELWRITEAVDRYTLVTPLGYVREGYALHNTRTRQGSREVSASGEGSGAGWTVGISATASESEEVGVTADLEYDDSEGGDYQLVYERSEVTVWQETIGWLAHWSESGEPDEQFETISTWEEHSEPIPGREGFDDPDPAAGVDEDDYEELGDDGDDGMGGDDG